MKIKVISNILNIMSIKSKILFLSILLIFIMLTTGLIGYLNINKLGSTNLNFTKTTLLNIINCHKMKENMEEIHMNLVLHIGFMNIVDKNNTEKDINLLNSEVIKTIDELKLFHENQSKIKQKIESKKNKPVKDTTSSEEKKDIDIFVNYYNGLKNEWNKYVSNIEMILQLSNSNDKDNAFYFYTDNGRLIFLRVMDNLESILKEYDKEISASIILSEKTMKSSGINLLMVLISGAILSIYISIVIGRSIVNPLKEVVEVGNEMAIGILPEKNLIVKSRDEIAVVADVFNRITDTLKNKCCELSKIAEGDLSIQISSKSDKDTFALTFKKMLSSLNVMISQIDNSATQVSFGASQIAQASQNLSDGATLQASSLEEITSSTTEINSQIKLNSENAVQASALAKKTLENSEMGNNQMNELITAMNNITKSAGEIKKIVKVIDEIAFQTNLLALNANVEAARAGKYGKGFAVVAEEVRNLAGRSAVSVKETTGMVEEAVKNIMTGNNLVEVTAKQFAEITVSANKVSNLVDEIATASKEQTLGLEQINQGLGQIDQVTQNNTANAEETASAVEELAGQAEQLKNIVGKFNISGEYKKTAKEAGISKLMEKTKHDEINKSFTSIIHDKDEMQNNIKQTPVNPKHVIKLDDDNFGKF